MIGIRVKCNKYNSKEYFPKKSKTVVFNFIYFDKPIIIIEATREIKIIVFGFLNINNNKINNEIIKIL